MKTLGIVAVVLAIIAGSSTLAPEKKACVVDADCGEGYVCASEICKHGPGDHWSLLALLPDAAKDNIQGLTGVSYVTGEQSAKYAHVAFAVFVFLFLTGLALAARKTLKGPDAGVIPDTKLTPLTFFELITDGVFGMLEGLMGREKAKETFPIVGGLCLFILTGNLIGMVPGLLPPTDNLNTNIGLAVTVFVLTHFYGLKTNGVAYLKHFMGPIPWLAPLMLPIELISHIARPASLALRLTGNMFGDHTALGIFVALHFLLVPIPLMALGFIVCIVQTLVFCLLTMVYFSMAVEDLSHH